MERLQNLSGINTNTIEGRLLIAAMAKISTESQTDKEPDHILGQVHDLAEHIYKNADPLPSSEAVQETFDQGLVNLINKHSIENKSDTPDFILLKFITSSLDAYNAAVKHRDKWHGFIPFGNKK